MSKLISEGLGYSSAICKIARKQKPAKISAMLQERDELLSQTAALEKRCADAEELLEGFNSSLSSLQATWTAKAKAFTDAQDS